MNRLLALAVATVLLGGCANQAVREKADVTIRERCQQWAERKHPTLADIAAALCVDKAFVARGDPPPNGLVPYESTGEKILRGYLEYRRLVPRRAQPVSQPVFQPAMSLPGMPVYDQFGRPGEYRALDGSGQALGPIKHDVYGPGVSSDATGRAVGFVPW